MDTIQLVNEDNMKCIVSFYLSQIKPQIDHKIIQFKSIILMVHIKFYNLILHFSMWKQFNSKPIFQGNVPVIGKKCACVQRLKKLNCQKNGSTNNSIQTLKKPYLIRWIHWILFRQKRLYGLINIRLFIK